MGRQMTDAEVDRLTEVVLGWIDWHVQVPCGEGRERILKEQLFARHPGFRLTGEGLGEGEAEKEEDEKKKVDDKPQSTGTRRYNPWADPGFRLAKAAKSSPKATLSQPSPSSFSHVDFDFSDE